MIRSQWQLTKCLQNQLKWTIFSLIVLHCAFIYTFTKFSSLKHLLAQVRCEKLFPQFHDLWAIINYLSERCIGRIIGCHKFDVDIRKRLQLSGISLITMSFSCYLFVFSVLLFVLLVALMLRSPRNPLNWTMWT